jgi:hypothetical protein
MPNFYDIAPKIKTYPDGTVFKNKCELQGTPTYDPDEGEENIIIPPDSILTFVDDKQFIGSTKSFGQSAWVRFQFLYDNKIAWVTIFRDQTRIWNFETHPGKKRLVNNSVNEMFELICLGSGVRK